jgi:hypothetical protein
MSQFYYRDNLQVLREHIADESVDLNYLDPPAWTKPLRRGEGPPFDCRAGFGIYMDKLSCRFLIKETL